MGLYIYVRWAAADSFESSLSSAINLDESECVDLMSRSFLRSQDVERLYGLLAQQYPTGLINIQQLAEAIKPIIKQAEQRAESEAVARLAKRDSLLSALRAEAPANASDAALERLVHGSDERPWAEAIKAAEDEKRPVSIDLVDLLAMFRHSPVIKAGGFLDLRELATGLALLIDEKTEDIQDIDRVKEGGEWQPISAIRIRHSLPAARLLFAWRVADEDGDGRLNFQQLTELIARLVRLGHYNRRSLVYQSNIMPPQFSLLQPHQLAERLFALSLFSALYSTQPPTITHDHKQTHNIDKQTHKHDALALFDPLVPAASVDSAVALSSSWPPECAAAFSGRTLSYQQFLTLTELMAALGSAAPFYLPPRDEHGKKLGFFKRLGVRLATAWRVTNNVFTNGNQQQQTNLHQYMAT